MTGLVVALALGSGSPARGDDASPRFENQKPFFRVDIPFGFRVVPAGGVILCRLESGAKPPTVVTIEGLGGLLPREEPEDRLLQVANVFPHAQAELEVEGPVWRGVQLERIQVHIPGPPGQEMAVFLARVPLAGEAIQVNVGGPEARSAELSATLDAVLQGLQGRPLYAEDARREQAVAVGAIVGGVLLLGAGAVAVTRGRRREAAQAAPGGKPA